MHVYIRSKQEISTTQCSLPYGQYKSLFCMCCVSTWTVEIIVSVVAVELLNKGAWYVSTNKPNPGANRCDRYDGYFPVLITQVTPTLLQNSFQTAELKSSISLALQYIRHLSVVKSKLPAVQL